jgi:hypothetical protein
MNDPYEYEVPTTLYQAPSSRTPRRGMPWFVTVLLVLGAAGGGWLAHAKQDRILFAVAAVRHRVAPVPNADPSSIVVTRDGMSDAAPLPRSFPEVANAALPMPRPAVAHVAPRAAHAQPSVDPQSMLDDGLR